ncbi:hypothetical protein [Agromyces bauzanensis]|uniref:Uncharacterized protein n=1 Tax=Agromyces bauzanensis TaxID=1308924 RepID=A0A917PH12_9MICO|nr:hypothetical protein [Agromyces bauzanensis]GGJ76654.1 hypothetical protein GCM10011372_13610 [Agromyces bauzanensis]
MTISQEQFDDLLGRTALAALFYYPEVTVENGEYRIQDDVAYCLQAVEGLPADDIERLGQAVARAIADPTAYRSELLALVVELAPPLSE